MQVSLNVYFEGGKPTDRRLRIKVNGKENINGLSIETLKLTYAGSEVIAANKVCK